MKKHKHTFKIGLRDEITDFVTGATGVVISCANHNTGCDTYEIAPKTIKDGVPADSYYLQEPRVVGGKSFSVEFAFETGAEVQDKIHGFKGVVTLRLAPLCGMNRYGLTKYSADKTPLAKDDRDFVYYDECQLELVKSDVVKMSKADRPGGPGKNPGNPNLRP
jgi:hypothetical protein